MAESDPNAAPAAPAGPIDLPSIQAAIAALGLQQPAAPQPAPVDRSVVSLLGEALGGGDTGMSPAEREAAGTRALLNFGTNMMAASGPSVMPRSFGQIFGQGVGGAEQSLAGSEEVSAARLTAQQQYAEKEQELRINALREAIPLLQMQQLSAAKKALLGGGGAPGTSIAAAGSIGAPVLARDTSMTAGQQGNNPGNVTVTPGSPLPAGASGAIPVAGGQYVAAFPDVPTGVAAHSDTLNGYAASGTNTIRAAVTKWVGDPNVPKATMDSYVADVAKAAGVDPDATIDLTDPKVQRAFILAQQPHESGKTWLSPGDVDKGLALATARRQGRPGGPATAAAPQGAPAAPAPTATAPAAKPGTPALPVPPAPPVITDQTGGDQVAGPGAPSAARVRAVSPAVPGDVNAMIRGMTGAGADQTTLALPGPAAPPVAPAPAVVAGPGAPPTPEALPLADAMAKAKATGQPVLFQGGNGAAIKPDGTINMPSAAPAPTPPAPDRVPSSFTYTRQPLPPDIQQRIDNPVPPDQLKRLNDGISTAMTSEALQAAQNAKDTAIAKARTDAITQGEAWQQANAKQMQEVWQKQLDIQQQNDLKQKDIDQANATAAATRQQERDMETLRNNDAQVNTAITDERTANRTRIGTMRTAADSAQQNINTIQVLRSIESGLPEEGSVGAYLARRYPDSVHLISQALNLTDDQVNALTAQELFQRAASTLGTQLSEKAKEGAGTARGAEITQNMAALPTVTMNHAGRIQSLAFLQNLAQFQVNRADAAEDFLSKHVSTDPLIAGKVNTLNGFSQDFEKNGPPIIPRIAPNAGPADVYKAGVRPGMLADFPQPNIDPGTGLAKRNKDGTPSYSYRRGILGDDGAPIWYK